MLVNESSICDHRAEDRTSGDRQLEIRCATFVCNFDLILLWIRLQINEIEASYIKYTLYFDFNGGVMCGRTSGHPYGSLAPSVSALSGRYARTQSLRTSSVSEEHSCTTAGGVI